MSVESRKTDALIDVLRSGMIGAPRNILVVGCGTGLEAGALARAFDCNTIGIDIGAEYSFDHEAAAPAKLMTMDAQRLEFPADSFDLVYSFHALEHIERPNHALSEMGRVLRPGGTYLIGTPNKSRLLGYVGAPTSLANKIRWNLKDLQMRLAGRWSNESGAHAGFTEAELKMMCSRAFKVRPRSVSDVYYRTLYSGKRNLIGFLSRSGLSRALYPCVYVSGIKPATEA